MALRRLGLTNFRCFAAAEIELPGENTVIHGANASGKTSLLEAVFYLAQGRSFRTTHARGLIRYQAESFQITGQLSLADRMLAIGVERKQQLQHMRLAGQPVKSWAEMAEALPVQLIDAEIHRLLAEGPRYRRRFLDWGAFHVEHGFLPNWRRYQRALKQRNSALRRHTPQRERYIWDQELAETGEKLSAQRLQYLEKLQPLARELAQAILQVNDIELLYRPGWPADMDLLTALQTGVERDLQQGNTHYGPHRAELLIRVDGADAQECLSRGQHKILASSLVLAQGRLLAETSERQPILLLDDLAAELDREHLSRVLAALTKQPGQKIFTAITPNNLPLADLENPALFHVEHGRIR